MLHNDFLKSDKEILQIYNSAKQSSNIDLIDVLEVVMDERNIKYSSFYKG